MPSKPVHVFNGPDQHLVEQLPPEFWTLMRSMLPMRRPTKTELKCLNWCEAATLSANMDGNVALATDSWSVIELYCSYLIANGRLHLGHIEAMIHARIRCRIAASRRRR